ncbi:hypothetical protein Salat_2564100 [Sesamum alatum]|uniref:Uncharacterized protein n=1 Tax=Sesamum alatum TaxID=300844 RepID=A0AAE1XSY2_9LAMI|nr:hypothetical protein Salat_2564100 [Sesamum alatum]
MRTLLEEAAERGAQATPRWAWERQEIPPLSKMEERKIPLHEDEGSVCSSKASTNLRARSHPENLQIDLLRKELEELCKQLIPPPTGIRRGSPFSPKILSAPLTDRV